MLKHITFGIRLSTGYAHSLCKDIPDAEFASQPVPGQTLNHAAWVIGHLAASNDFATMLLGHKDMACPKEWEALFGIGSKPLPDRSKYPSKEVLLAALDKSTEYVIKAFESATPEQLNAQSPEMLRGWFPTIGDFVLYDLTTHAGTHLGQLSAWRRAKGHAPLF